MLKILTLSTVMLLCMISNAFAQCGADGNQPCGSTTNKTTAKTTKQTTSKSVTKVKQKSNAAISSLRNRLIGTWDNKKGFKLKYFSSGLGEGTSYGEISYKVRWSLKGDILTEKTIWCADNTDCKVGEIEYSRIHFDDDDGALQFIWVTDRNPVYDNYTRLYKIE